MGEREYQLKLVLRGWGKLVLRGWGKSWRYRKGEQKPCKKKTKNTSLISLIV